MSADPIVLCGIECMKMCRFVCVAANQLKLETVTPYGKCFLAYYLRKEAITGRGRVAEAMYQCATCGLCKEWCLPKVDIPEIVKEVRAKLVKDGNAPEPTLEIGKKTKSEKNPYGEPHEKRFAALNKKGKSKMGSVAYFVGCTSAYRQLNIVNAMAKILEHTEGEFTLIDDEWCGGAPLLSTGHIELASEHAEHNKKAIEDSGCSVVVTSCAGCYMALSRYYPKMGFPLKVEVVHLSQYLWSAISEGKLKLKKSRKGGVKVTYHDPCHLGRHMGVYDEPRSVLSSIPGVQLVEMDWNRRNSKCCGSGGGLQLNFQELARRIGIERISEAVATGAEFLVTACPFCKNQLESVAEGKIRVYDLAEIVVEHLKV
ncbi:MAG: (Fe-S)-binding protein [Candidatus Jordarchaeales archaeon]